jgi:hypothetical protein
MEQWTCSERVVCAIELPKRANGVNQINWFTHQMHEKLKGPLRPIY